MLEFSQKKKMAGYQTQLGKTNAAFWELAKKKTEKCLPKIICAFKPGHEFYQPNMKTVKLDKIQPDKNRFYFSYFESFAWKV